MSDGGTVTAPVEAPKIKTESTLDVPWKVIVYNDPVNLMSFVVFVIAPFFFRILRFGSFICGRQGS